LAALNLSKGTWHYAQRKRSYEEKHSRLRQPLLEIAGRLKSPGFSAVDIYGCESGRFSRRISLPVKHHELPAIALPPWEGPFRRI